MPGYGAASGWLNGGPLTPEGLRGRVVLIDFWTYTCINWLRTLPYRRAWHAKYEPHGLTIVGAHTPEFGFERIEANVVPRAREFGVDYPIALDAEYGVWNAFANHYWPAVYIADAQGRIRYHHYRRGRVRDDRDGHPAPAHRRRRDRVRSGARDRRSRGLRGPGRLEHAPVARDVPRLRSSLRAGGARRCAAGPAVRLPRALRVGPQPLVADRGRGPLPRMPPWATRPVAGSRSGTRRATSIS